MLTSKRETLATAGRAGVTDYALRDFRAVFAASGVVVLTYRASGPFRIFATSVWAELGGRWRTIFYQATAD